MANFLFYFLSTIAVLAGIGVILAKSPVASTLALLTTFLALAVIYLLIGFPLLAALQVLVYAGAIMVLFLFVVMLLNLGDPEQAKQYEDALTLSLSKGMGVVVAAGLLLASAAGILGAKLGKPAFAEQERSLDAAVELASWMFGRYVLPFEAVSLLLLATAVGVLVLAKRERSKAALPASEETTAP